MMARLGRICGIRAKRKEREKGKTFWYSYALNLRLLIAPPR
jgi:hypothetical protein